MNLQIMTPRNLDECPQTHESVREKHISKDKKKEIEYLIQQRLSHNSW